MTVISTRVAGIPAQVLVTHYLHYAGNGNRWTADSPDDYYGFRECAFTVLDSRGRPAPWLEKKLDSKERDRIEAEISTYMESDE